MNVHFLSSPFMSTYCTYPSDVVVVQHIIFSVIASPLHFPVFSSACHCGFVFPYLSEYLIARPQSDGGINRPGTILRPYCFVSRSNFLIKPLGYLGRLENDSMGREVCSIQSM